MARYFMNLHDCGTLIADEEGLELTGLDEARRAAVRAARDVMCADVAEGTLCLASYIDVLDESGASVVRVPFGEAIEVTGVSVSRKPVLASVDAQA